MSINAPIPVVFFDEEDDLGAPLAGGKLYAYEAGTSTPKVTYTEPTGNTPGTHPIILNAAGRASVWLAAGAYKWILKDAADNVIWTQDNVGLESLSGTAAYVGSLTALRNLPDGQTSFSSLIMANSNVLSYSWDGASSASDNGFSIIVPTSAPATGRWILDFDNTLSSKVFTSLNDAITKISSANVTLIVSTAEILTADLTVPANITLKVIKGGSIAGAYTLTMTGLLESNESAIIDATTTVVFSNNHVIKSRWFSTFALAIASCGTSNVVLEHESAMTIVANLTVPSNVTLKIVNADAFLSVDSSITLTIEGQFNADRVSVFNGSGTVKVSSDSCPYIYPEWFGASVESADNTAAIQLALDAADFGVGYNVGRVSIAAGTFVCTGTLTVPADIILEGFGSSVSIIKHNPATFTDLIDGFGSGTGIGQIIIRNLGLKGRGVTTGNTRYLINITSFFHNCTLDNLQLSNSIGYISITNGIASSINNVYCFDSTPNIFQGGVNDTQWAEVWDVGSAPIKLTGMDNATITDLKTRNVGSATNATFGTPNTVVLIKNSESLVINGLEVNRTYNNGTYDLYANYIVSFSDCSACVVNGLNIIEDHAITSMLYFYRDTSVNINGCSANLVEGQYLAYSDAMHKIVIDGLQVENSKLISLYKVSATSTDFSYGNLIEIRNGSLLPGLLYTDATVSAYNLNVLDTFEMGSTYYGGVSDDNVHLHNPNRKYFPKSTSLAVTAGSVATYSDWGLVIGDYIQMTSGIFTNEAGDVLQIKKEQNTSAADVMCVFRLRPNTASKYYRLYINEAGGPYLVQSSSAFANDMGNWVAQFRTNASKQIVKYSDGVTLGLDGYPYNARASGDNKGQYIGRDTKAMMHKGFIPTIGQWEIGDVIFNSAPSITERYGWICTTAGTPGTWSEMNGFYQTSLLVGGRLKTPMLPVTAATDLTLPAAANAFVVTGGTFIERIDATDFVDGTIITLLFDSGTRLIGTITASGNLLGLDLRKGGVALDVEVWAGEGIQLMKHGSWWRPVNYGTNI